MLNLGDATITDPTSETSQPLFASIPNALRIVGFKRSTLYRLIGEGHITARKLGRKTVIDLRSLQAYLENLPIAQIGRCRATSPVADASNASRSVHQPRPEKHAKSAAA